MFASKTPSRCRQQKKSVCCFLAFLRLTAGLGKLSGVGTFHFNGVTNLPSLILELKERIEALEGKKK
jgi:hypothetical protein